MYTEGGFVEGESKKLGLFGDYVDIFRGIPFAAPPKTLEDPQPHPGWEGKIQLLNAFGLGFCFHFSLCSPLLTSQRCFCLLSSAKQSQEKALCLMVGMRVCV